jgi:cleavage and polyadenylation specificity factor subunit 2
MMVTKMRWAHLRCDSSEVTVTKRCGIADIFCFLRHLEFFPNPQALLQTYSSKDPKLILAVPASLSHGPSRHLFSDFAAVPDNVVLLTGRSEEGTLGRDLFNKWNDSQRVDDKWDKGKIGSNIMMDGVLKLRVRLGLMRNRTILLTNFQDESQSSSARSRA